MTEQLNASFGQRVLIFFADISGSALKNPPAMQEMQFQSLVQEDPLEEGMATHSSILAWKIPMDRGAWWAIVHGVTESQT